MKNFTLEKFLQEVKKIVRHEAGLVKGKIITHKEAVERIMEQLQGGKNGGEI